MKAKDLRLLSVNDLLLKNNQIQEDLFKLRFKHSIRRLEDPAKLRLLRKDLARIQTVLNEKK